MSLSYRITFLCVIFWQTYYTLERPVRHFYISKTCKVVSENTGKSIDEIAIATERDNYMTAIEAMDFGLIDKIIDKR